MLAPIKETFNHRGLEKLIEMLVAWARAGDEGTHCSRMYNRGKEGQEMELVEQVGEKKRWRRVREVLEGLLRRLWRTWLSGSRG